ncbi:EamA family transporter [Hyphomicrobium sp.]|uniref:EamA family transporter n=1 Tax=Hyphomicrobium sp. TaxID=82 RepID=UPI002B5854AD|nr:EamA family transporter [Hyphomicrobium sp.]HRN89647.1 EamA family transporter [Hyphomicrobium sp.]HRQ28304.1 EamA family transporter [Hyphomicrobium sp.]
MSPSSSALPLSHALLALAVTAVWGTNFVVIHIGLDQLPPLLFAALRFLGALLPAALLLKWPRGVPWRNLAAYGVLVGAGQFGLLYIAMNGHITPGLASLVVQTQVFFTIAMAAAFNGERLHQRQMLALLITLVGVGVILMHTDGATTPLGLTLVLAAAASWAASNIVVRATPTADMLAYVVWASLFAVPPLFALSFAFEGWPAIRDGLASADTVTWAAVAWQALGNTLFGYAAWSWLLARHPVANVAPMALMVPVFGIAASALWLGEPLQTWKLVAAALVMAGLALNLLWPRIAAATRSRNS